MIRLAISANCPPFSVAGSQSPRTKRRSMSRNSRTSDSERILSRGGDICPTKVAASTGLLQRGLSLFSHVEPIAGPLTTTLGHMPTQNQSRIRHLPLVVLIQSIIDLRGRKPLFAACMQPSRGREEFLAITLLGVLAGQERSQ